MAVPSVSARRSFLPMILYGSRGELVALWQEKTRSTPFSPAAPLRWAARMPGGRLRASPDGDGR